MARRTVLGKGDSRRYKLYALATLPICNNASIIIHDIDYMEDNIIWSYSFEDVVHVSSLRYRDEGTKFRVGVDWYNLNEFVRCDI